jgi:hypothetical protein
VQYPSGLKDSNVTASPLANSSSLTAPLFRTTRRRNIGRGKKGHLLDGHLEDLNIQVSTRPETITLFGQGEPSESDKVQGPVRVYLAFKPNHQHRILSMASPKLSSGGDNPTLSLQSSLCYEKRKRRKKKEFLYNSSTPHLQWRLWTFGHNTMYVGQPASWWHPLCRFIYDLIRLHCLCVVRIQISI